ncbi:hypothetical protein [Pseudomonas sp. Marseille-Q5115]|uniref:hypothetical protein n=1 Tax=Pseudomonas sp. Marseille-Q5115 TaxID=2866593 RepID=UPI001CE453C6|nr:hypothetical protein [Pseudomonas sp. Marseille-Q5115]
MDEIVSALTNSLWFFKFIHPAAAVFFTQSAIRLYQKKTESKPRTGLIAYCAAGAVLCWASTIILWAPYFQSDNTAS